MEGRRKEIILLVLAVAALGIALYTFRGNKPAPAPAAPPTAAAPGPAREGKPEAEGEQPAAEAALGTEGGEASAATADNQRNPFSTPGAVETAPQATASAQPQAQTAAEPPSSAVPVEGGSPITLTGVIDGQQSVAILRQGDQRFFVKVGDPVGEGYRVQSIGGQQVVLAGQQGKVILRMGGRQ